MADFVEKLTVPYNFGGLPLELSDFASSKVVIIPVPYELMTSYRSGTRNGPAAIIEASRNMELYDEELQMEPCQLGIHTLNYLEPVISPQAMIERVREAVAQVVAQGKFPVVLGGEHSITLGAVQALLKSKANLQVLQLDAHADLSDSYQGTKFSHACIGRRIQELCPLFQLGVRSLSKEEAESLKSESLNVRRLATLDLRLLDHFLEKVEGPVYVTLDLDVLDPGVMPAVGAPEPGGLDWQRILDIIKAIAKRCEIVGFDVVELCPIPGFIAPDFLAARLVYKMIGYFKAGRRY